jgi:hypothetical protein
MTYDKSDDAKRADLIRFLLSQKDDPSETYIVREAGGVARVDKLARRTKDGGCALRSSLIEAYPIERARQEADS